MKSSIKILFAIVFAFLLISPSIGFADKGKHEAKGGNGQDAGKQLEEGSGSSAMETPGGPAGAAKAAMEEGKGEYKEHKGEKGELKAMEEGSDSKASPVATPKKKEGSSI